MTRSLRDRVLLRWSLTLLLLAALVGLVILWGSR
jgi:hypothetical protein